MNRLFLFIFILLSFCANGQKCVVANESNMVVFVGIKNTIEFAAEGYQCKDLLITTDNGQLEKTNDPCRFMITPENNKLVTITLCKKDAKKTKIGTKNFQSRNLPDPVPVFAGKKKGGDISVSIIKEQLGISSILEGVGYDTSFPVTNYTITIIHALDAKVFTRTYAGDKFPPEVIEALHQVKENDKIVFTDMTYRKVYKNTSNAMGNLRSMEIRATQ